MLPGKKFYVYVLANRKRGALYIGITSDIGRRIYEHKNGIIEGHTKKYGIHRPIYYEVYGDSENAITREKRLKEWKRSWKLELIEKHNPDWTDLWDQLNN